MNYYGCICSVICSNLLAGSARFATCPNNDNQECTDRSLQVTDQGTVVFDLTLEFDEAGPSEHLQEVRRTVLKTGGTAYHICSLSGCDDQVDRWWDVVGSDSLPDLTLTLHEVVHGDLGTYEVTTELQDPAIESISSITKNIDVDGKSL